MACDVSPVAMFSPCETLQRNCKMEQGHCRMVLQVQVQVQGRCMTEEGLHRRVQGVPRTLQSRPQKSSSQRPCLQKVFKLSQINFKLRPNEAGNVDVIVTYGRKSADRTEHGNDVTFLVFLATVFGNLEVWKVRK